LVIENLRYVESDTYFEFEGAGGEGGWRQMGLRVYFFIEVVSTYIVSKHNNAICLLLNEYSSMVLGVHVLQWYYRRTVHGDLGDK
jgi:hypothetical protein